MGKNWVAEIYRAFITYVIIIVIIGFGFGILVGKFLM